MTKTSLSDKKSYTEVCKLAAIDDNVFNTFKQNPGYNEILEHTSYELGLAYLTELPDDFNFDAGRLNDKFGGAQPVNYPNIGMISPSSLRYLKVANEIKTLFGSTQDFNIGEVGCGYGAQSLILHRLYGWKSYEFYDLIEPLLLIEKYLKVNDINTDESCGFNYGNDINSFEKPEYDLVISNYAFSELTRKIQDIYLDKVLLPAKRGYLTMNFISRTGGIYSYSRDEILEELSSKNPQVLPEIPLTSPDNLVIIWGQND